MPILADMKERENKKHKVHNALNCMIIACLHYPLNPFWFLNIDLQSMDFSPSSNLMRSQMSLSYIDFISSFMALINFQEL